LKPDTKTKHVSYLELDMNALQYNVSYFKKKLKPNTKLLAVVKAFSYGNDAIAISTVLEKNNIDYLAVAYTEEGVALRTAGVRLPILVLHAQIQTYEAIIAHDLEPNIYSKSTLEAFSKIASEKKQKDYPVHIKFNTGLNRLGFAEEAIDFIIKVISKTPHLKIQSVFSHLAASEDLEEIAFTKSQIEKFNVISEKITAAFSYKIDLHLANTSGIINFPEAHLGMVRLGIGMYGFGNDEKETAQLKNVGSLKTIISQIHEIKPGETLGYNRAHKATKLTKTATLPIGHADGISRQLGNKKGSVLINNTPCFILGNVCMDMIMVDVTEVGCEEGDEVIIFNNQQMVNELAQNANTISYEILTGISQRIPRKVLD